jgi:hypothetical protein
LPSNGTVEHPTECGTIDGAGMDAEANDPARVLIHDHKDPVGPQRSRFAPEQIHAPEAVFRVPQESQPGRTIRVQSMANCYFAKPHGIEHCFAICAAFIGLTGSGFLRLTAFLMILRAARTRRTAWFAFVHRNCYCYRRFRSLLLTSVRRSEQCHREGH